jgi:probable rRNA maturation factor
MSTRKARSAPDITVTVGVGIDTQMWTRALPRVAAVCRRAALAALATAPRIKAAEVNILLTTDAAVRKLNAAYRGKDKPTNVLAFPALDPTERRMLPKGLPVPLGDIAIAYGVTAREAKAEDKSLKAHLTHLVVHGVLHLLGYDHMQDDDAATMERKETRILAGLGISDPYAPVPELPRKARKARR